MLVHVGAVVDEPAKPVEVFEVDLVADEGLRARFPERLEQRRAAVLARVVERVVVPLAPVGDEQLDEGRVVAVDGAANGREVPVPPSSISRVNAFWSAPASSRSRAHARTSASLSRSGG